MPFFPIDPASAGLPDDVKKAIAAKVQRQQAVRLSAAVGEDPDDVSFNTPSPSDESAANDEPLDRWDVQTHSYRKELAAKAGLFGSLFSGKVESVNAGVVQEAKRYRVESTEQGTALEFGTSVRLSVATTLESVESKLTIPNLAAEAQLSDSDTRIGIAVIGFVGPLGELLPAPSDLDVEKYAIFMEAFRNVQKFVFGAEGAQYLAPTFLGYGDAATPPSDS